MQTATPAPVDDSGAQFQRACAQAVAESRPVAARLREMVLHLCAGLVSTPGEDEEGKDDEAARVTGQIGAALQAMVTDQLAEIGTFNVVFFGRTGAGKSTLITALGRGDGTLISPGDNDFTTEVGALLWQGSRLVDTPGTGGWGRTVDAVELHERARAAVRTADLVLLCFDDTVTQITEFAEISRWVAEYGKQAIAVLNIKNALWRQPPRVPDPATRRQLSDAVAQSALWLAGQLAEIGLAEVPIVAVNSRRAAFARLPESYDGYDATTFRKHRREYGVDNLMTWSHVSTLERLMTTAISTDAVGLRLGSLSRQLVSQTSSGARDLTELAQRLRTQAAHLEQSIAEVLWVFGDSRHLHLAGGGTAEPASPRAGQVLAELTELDRRSDHAIFPDGQGVVADFVANLLTSHLGPWEREALRRAEAVVDDAYAHGMTIDAEEFAGKVFQQEEIGRAVQAVADAFTTHLRHRLDAVEANLSANLAPLGTSFDGSAGKSLRVSGAIVRYGSAIAAAGTVVFPPMALVGIAGDVLGRTFRKKGLIRQNESRAAALAQARLAVHDHFQQVSQEIRTRLLRVAFDHVISATGELASSALNLRDQADLAGGRARLLLAAGAEIGPTGRGHHAVAAAVATLEARYAATGRPGRRLWLGDDWVEEAGSADADPVTARPFPPEHRVVAARVTQSLRRTIHRPVPGSASRWLDAWSSAPDDEAGEAAVAVLRSLHAEQLPRVVVIGDRGTGKTALVRRLAQLTEAEVLIEPGPTRQPHRYRWEGVTLLDTPPLGPDGVAIDAVGEAAFVLYLLSPNLTATPYLSDILNGDAVRGVLPRADRAIFIIGHADVMGADPVDSPEEFARRCRRKEIELLGELHRLQGPRERVVAGVQVVCLAPDPVSGTGMPADWDGTADFVAGWRAARAELAGSADSGVLLGAVARMAQLDTAGRATLAELAEGLAGLSMLEADLRLRLQNAIALRAAAVERLDWIVIGTLRGLLDQWDRAVDKEERAAVARQILQLHQQPDLHAHVNEWAATARRQVEHWAQDMAREDIPGHLPQQRGSAVRLQATFLQRATSGSGVMGRTGSAVSALARLKSVGRFAGEGSKVASRFIRIAPFVPLLATTAEDLLSARSRRRRTDEREEGEVRLFEDARRWIGELVAGHQELSWLAAQGVVLQQAIDETAAEAAHDTHRVRQLTARLYRYHEARNLALSLLKGDQS